MKILINSQETEFKKRLSLEEALNSWGNQPCGFSVAVNKRFVPKAEYGHTLLKEGDCVDIVTPMQGG